MSIGGTHNDYGTLSSISGKKKRNFFMNDIWQVALFNIVVAAKANGLRAIDCPYGDFNDDEGFKAKEGRLSYLRMIGSTEANCKGQKQGHCFPADLPRITVQTKPIGDVWLHTDQLYVTWYGCTQDYRFFQDKGFVTVKPEGKDCFWSRERHFYVAPYKGQVLQQ